MSIIQDKYNIRLDFESQHLNVPIDDRIFTHYRLDHKAFIANYVAVAGGQLFDARKTIYRFDEGGFYLTVFFEQPRIGILFIPDKDTYTAEYLEKLRIYCEFKKIRLITVRLYAESDDEFTKMLDDNNLEINISGREKLETLDTKLKSLMSSLIDVCFNRSVMLQKQELYGKLDTQLCYRLGILLSIRPKEPEKDVKTISRGKYIEGIGYVRRD